MEENNKKVAEYTEQPEAENSTFDFATIYTTLILNWKWFLLSIIICLGTAAIYLRYKTPVYQASAKLLIKDNNTNTRRGMLNSSTFGTISNSAGIENEMEILTSHSLAQQAVRDLKLYTNYYSMGKVKEVLNYKTQPINVDVDPEHLEKLNAPISLTIEREGSKYHVEGTYYVSIGDNKVNGPYAIDKTLAQLPASIGTRAGILSFSLNGMTPMSEGLKLKVTITSPRMAAYKYVAALDVAQTNKSTTIAQLVVKDESPQRAMDYLQQLALCYNRQANEDKNEVAMRTEEFINGRLEKINAELGNTEGQLESYKRRNNIVQLDMNAGQAMGNADEYAKKLAEANTQVQLADEMVRYMNNPANKNQPLPSNVGIDDQSVTSLISNYNTLVQRRNLLLQSASESSPSVTPLTSQIGELEGAIRRSLNQTRRNMNIQRNSVASQYSVYQGRVGQNPEQERMLTQIGRQQEVKSGLYLMLLQKREENSISLAATADKGKLIDQPTFMGQVSPDRNIILLVALLVALLLPALILFLIQFFHYKIEGHEDVARLTKLPILADVAVASETAKTKADIVVHENKNNMMEEIFRSLRTNLQFMLTGDQKVIMFTSTISGEGKTFITSNLSVSFALLGKKVILVGLDIRKPRLAELFEINDNSHGITNLLVRDNPDWATIQSQILPSGINNNLDLLMAGPIPPNPAELVSRKSLGEIFAELRQHYDYILVDTAPVGLVTDTIQVGNVCDLTVYTCRADYTPKESFELINNLAATKKLPKIGIVINGIDMSKKKYGYYYGYGRYGRYGRYRRYGNYGHHGTYGSYGSYGNYSKSHYGDVNDDSIKK
ncbi:GumC family protein [Hallella colorans]|uniref:GumC family protein n=1 Tax=Hallella colorans TaxID=1703337 RepID=UPI00248ED2DC|nr:polysaccharide biosynthesis tyrosine autokinase [Hallella colorans]